MKKFRNDKNNVKKSQINMQKFEEKGIGVDEKGIWANLWFDYNYRKIYMNPQKMILFEKISKKLNLPMKSKRNNG